MVFSATPFRRYSTSGCQLGMARAKLIGRFSSKVPAACCCSSRMVMVSHEWHYSFNEIVHIFHDAFRVMIIEVEPQHEPVLGIEPLLHLRGDGLRVAYQCVVGCAPDFLLVERPLQGAP